MTKVYLKPPQWTVFRCDCRFRVLVGGGSGKRFWRSSKFARRPGKTATSFGTWGHPTNKPNESFGSRSRK